MASHQLEVDENGVLVKNTELMQHLGQLFVDRLTVVMLQTLCLALPM